MQYHDRKYATSGELDISSIFSIKKTDRNPSNILWFITFFFRNFVAFNQFNDIVCFYVLDIKSYKRIFKI